MCTAKILPKDLPRTLAPDGGGILLALKEFYLGPNMINELASAAEGQINKARYTGETKRWNFETYVALHKAKNQILSDPKKTQLKDWRIAEEAKEAKQVKAMQVQISQIQAKINVDDGGSKWNKSNSNNNSLQGINRTVRIEDKDDE